MALNDIKYTNTAGSMGNTETCVVVAGAPEQRPFEDMHLPTPKRMIVLAPELLISEIEFAQKIWALASGAQIDVLYIALVNSSREKLSAELRLASLSAITQDARIEVETCVAQGRNWLKAIQAVWQPGDLIICHAGQLTPKGFMKQAPLAEEVIAQLNAPVYIISGLYQAGLDSWKHKLLKIPYWLALVVIVFGFFGVEARLYQMQKSPVSTMLTFIIFLIEVGLIWIWNSVKI